MKKLNFYRERMIDLVKAKQAVLKDIYLSNKSLSTDKMSSLFTNCIYKKITPKNFGDINAQIDQIGKLAFLNGPYSKIKNLFQSGVWHLSDELKIVSQHYYTVAGLIEFTYDKYPWKYLPVIYKFGNYDTNI